MNKIYLVIRSDMDMCITVAAFSNKEIAEHYAKLQSEIERNEISDIIFYVTSINVDEQQITLDTRVEMYYEYTAVSHMFEDEVITDENGNTHIIKHHSDEYNNQDDAIVNRIYDKDTLVVIEYLDSEHTEYSVTGYALDYDTARELALNKFTELVNPV